MPKVSAETRTVFAQHLCSCIDLYYWLFGHPASAFGTDNDTSWGAAVSRCDVEKLWWLDSCQEIYRLNWQMGHRWVKEYIINEEILMMLPAAITLRQTHESPHVHLWIFMLNKWNSSMISPPTQWRFGVILIILYITHFSFFPLKTFFRFDDLVWLLTMFCHFREPNHFSSDGIMWPRRRWSLFQRGGSVSTAWRTHAVRNRNQSFRKREASCRCCTAGVEPPLVSHVEWAAHQFTQISI